MTMETSPSIAALADALAKAQASVEGATKGKVNPAFKSKYADLASVWEACREALTQNGLSVLQSPGELADGRMEMTTLLMHSSGEWVRGSLTIPLGKVDAQGYGSATTYARRFALAAFVGVAPSDDDGNAAVAQAPKPRSAYAAKKDGLGPRADELIHELRETIDDIELNQWGKDRADEIRTLPDNWQRMIREEFEEQRIRLRASDMDDAFRQTVGGSGGSSATVPGRNGALV
jgi:uncharacterized protein YukE